MGLKIEHVHVCPYCGSEVGYEPTELCCGEVHGEWQYLDEDGEQRTKEEYDEQCADRAAWKPENNGGI